MKEQEQPSGRKRGGFAGAHVLRRGSVARQLSARPLAGPAHPGVRHPGQWAWPMRGVACAQVPPRPARSVASAVVRAARRRAGPALSPPSSPPPVAGSTGFAARYPGAIVNPLHGEFPWESTGAQASGSEAGARPEPGRRDGLRARTAWGMWMNEAPWD